MKRMRRNKNREGQQLVSDLPEEFKYFSHITSCKDVYLKSARRTSCLNWPDGRFCFEGTAFLQREFEKGLATEVRGGTVKTKAFHISHLIRFCYQNKVDFINLIDAQFTLFTNNMLTESVVPGNLASGLLRTGSTPHDICRDALDFLHYVGELHGEPAFVSEHGPIRGKKVARSRSNADGVPTTFYEYWEREGLPKRGEIRSRVAISDDNLRKLTSSVSGAVSKGKFQLYRKRRLHVILRLLRILGCRRTELQMLKVSDFVKAASMTSPKLTVTTLKHKRAETREVEINHIEINEVLKFVEYFRSVVVAETCGKESDDGFLLISATSGRQLKENTITQIVSELRNVAGITEQACAHMFRNLFIVERLCGLMEKHNKLTKDEFRRAMLDKQALLKEVMKETGQKSMQTTLRYLAGAEAKLANLQKIKKSVRAEMLDESLKVCQEQHALRMSEGVPELVSLRIFQDSVGAARKEARSLLSDD